jgi:endoglucanase
MRASERKLLETILRLPTAPFREHYIQAAIENAARKLELGVRRDRYGNLYVGYHHGKARPVAFTAHMDHPGFEIVEAGRTARAAFLGGVGAEHMPGAAVLCYPDQSRSTSATPPEPVRGRVARVESRTVEGSARPQLFLELEFDAAVQSGDFGCWDLEFEIDAEWIRARALDNLLSCVLILVAFASLKRRGVAADALGVFTRAEEVGFVGAGGVLRSPQLGTTRPLVVLETSKELPGVRQGGGPILRVGDRMTCFDPLMDLWLAHTAADLAAHEPEFVYQRALMTGGACEASLYMLHGRQVGALALALGNYHNMKPEVGIGAEYISVHDFEHTLLLMEHLAANPPDSGILDKRRAELDATFDRLSPRLELR